MTAREENSGRLSQRLAVFAAGLRAEDLPQDVVRAVKRSILDQVGVIAAASGLGGDCKAFVETAKEAGGSGATLIGCRAETSPAMAALANGAMAHALDFEDTHDATLVHPSASSVPAALAVGERLSASGSELIAAVCAGSEVACRIGASFVGSPQDGHFFLLPLVNAFGATAAAGRMLGLNAEQMEHAFGLAMSQVVGSAAVLTEPGSSFREIRDGFNAKAGVLAAQLASRGVRSFRSPLEAEHGYYAMFQGGRFDPSAFEGLGDRFEVANVSYKPWPACRGTHVFIEAALDLSRRHSLQASDIESIVVDVSPFFTSLCEPESIRKKPKTATEAKFSIPFALAVTLVEGNVDLASFDAEKRGDAAILALAGRVRHRSNDAPQDQSTRGGLTLETKDGRQFHAEYEEPLGHPSRPIDDDRLREKFRLCVAKAACPTDDMAAELFIERTAALEAVTDIGSELIALL